MEKCSLVSFLVISYKHKKYIDDCFRSILDQTYTNMEILYLDDASGDGTFEKAYEYKEKIERKFHKVTFIQNKSNLGLVKSLNMLIGLCHGEYIKFLAADDFLFPNGIENLVNFMDEYLQHDMVYSNGIIGNENIHFPIEDINRYDCVYQTTPPSGKALFELLYDKDFISAPGVMLRKEVYKKVGLYDENIGVEDWDIFLRIAEKGSIGYTNKITVMYRMLEDSLSHSSNPERRINMKKSELLILEKYKNLARQSNERITTCLNEALSDAFHIGNREYLLYLYMYAKTNKVRICPRNLIKYVLYKIKIIRVYNLFNR